MRWAYLAIFLASCGPAAQPVPPTAPPTIAPSRGASVATPGLLWTAPPLAVTTGAPSPSPTAAPVVVVPPTLEPTPAPTRSARPTASPDPFRWTGYDVNGSLVFVPAAWTVVEPTGLRGLGIFAASPEAPRASIVSYRTLMRLQFVATAAPGVTLERFADALRDTIAAPDVTRERIAHPSGGAVLFKYRTPGPDGAFDQQVEAAIMGNGHVYLLSLRSPLDRVAQNAPVFNEIVQRFRPG